MEEATSWFWLSTLDADRSLTFQLLLKLAAMEDAAQSPLRPPTRPSLARSYSDLSVAAAANEPIHPDRQPTVLMNKRHSFVTASHIPFEWKDSGSPPNRPPRNPARTMTQNFDNTSNVVTNNTMAGPSKPRKSTRPSTASGTREAVTPWELYPVPDWDQQLPVRPSVSPDPRNATICCILDGHIYHFPSISRRCRP